MSEEATPEKKVEGTSGRRNFIYTLIGGAIAAFSGWMAGSFQREKITDVESSMSAAETRISALEGEVAQFLDELLDASGIPQLAQLEGEMNERVVFNKSELSVINPEGVLLNLVATDGHVGIRFYKDFGFGNEKVTNPWHMGFIEGVEGYQGLAILRDWLFTSALWDEDGKLIVGRLHPHPPANQPAKARFEVRGTLDEVQAMVEGNRNQASDIFQVIDGEGTKYLTVNGSGNVVVGSSGDPKEVVMHDTVDGSAYSLNVTDGRLTLTKI
ncbi:MAG: hypothetical protein ACXACD_16000 [Candidatus Thorarchaeota archaeon]|jgi:hypothetical protein